MDDPLSRIQDSVNQLAIQMYSCLRYIDSRHPPVPVPGQAFFGMPPYASTMQQNVSASNTPAPSQAEPQQGEQPILDNTTDPEIFKSDLQELAHDLVLKEQHIELLVKTLPGVENTQEMQERRIKELQEELQQVEAEVREARSERDGLVKRVEKSLMSIKRV